MKKFSLFLLPLLAVAMLTACGDDDKPVNKQIVTMVTNNRAIDGDAVVFSQGSDKVELNYTDMTIQFTGDFNDADGNSRSLTTPNMNLTNVNDMVYRFNTNNTSSSTYTGIDNLTGYIDMSTGMIWYSFDDGSSRVVSSSQLLYAYTTTTLTNPDNGNHSSHNQSAYLFAIDSKGETCTMKVSNFITNINGSVQATEIQYNNLKVTPTTTGYIITAEEAESSYRGFYTITDLNITLDSQCLVMNGSFKSGDLDFTLSGNLFRGVGGSTPQ
jgi:hypothetical protein